MQRAWLRSNVVDRFDEYEKENGMVFKVKTLCVNDKRWTKSVDDWLVNKGFYIIETGYIDTVEQKKRTSAWFFEEFTDILVELCSNKLNPRALIYSLHDGTELYRKKIVTKSGMGKIKSLGKAISK